MLMKKLIILTFLNKSIEKAVSLKCPHLVIHSDALNPEDGSAIGPWKENSAMRLSF